MNHLMLTEMHWSRFGIFGPCMWFALELRTNHMPRFSSIHSIVQINRSQFSCFIDTYTFKNNNIILYICMCYNDNNIMPIITMYGMFKWLSLFLYRLCLTTAVCLTTVPNSYTIRTCPSKDPKTLDSLLIPSRLSLSTTKSRQKYYQKHYLISVCTF